MNASAVAMFALSPEVKWLEAAVLAASSTVGYLVGVWLLLAEPPFGVRHRMTKDADDRVLAE